MIMKTILKVIIILFCIPVIPACKDKTVSKEISANEVGISLPDISTTKAVLSNRQEELTLTGVVKTDPDKEIKYVPLISGVIDRVYFSLGDKVQKDRILLDIRSTELSTIQSELVTLDSEVKIAERECTAARDMFNDNMISEKEFIEAQAKLKQAQAALDKVKTDVSVFGTNNGKGIFSIKAPMSGYITYKNVSSGSTVSADGEPLFTIVDLSSVWVTANVYAGDLMFVKEGIDAEISTFSYPGEIFKGKINKLSQVFDPDDKALKARIILSNDELKFKPEMSVMIKLKNETDNQLISIPSDALIFDNDRYFVVVEKEPGDFEKREVSIRGHSSKITYIASGLNEGENVVVKNQLLLYFR